ncbi:importin subunit alpha-7-like isoform X2 [Sycon ciliatum]|uniref:importin subunit alpha-7-like isoform X2 n=1 Tax=Sycon ciliatum TaxID=27933 RepID=UPI0031F64077
MASNRQKDFKRLSSSVGQMRKRRESDASQLQKSRRGEEHLKRRNLLAVSTEKDTEQQHEAMDVEVLPCLQDCDTLVEKLMHGDFDTQLQAAQHCRRLVSTKNDEAIDRLVQLQVCPLCVARLREPPATSTDFMSLWALGNIAGDNSNKLAYRDMLLDAGVVSAVTSAMLTYSGRVSVIRNAAWLLSNLCRACMFLLELMPIRPLIPVLLECMLCDDDEVVSKANHAIGYLATTKSAPIREELLQSGVAGPLINCLSHGKVGVVSQALRSLGSLLCCDNDQSQVIIDAGILPGLRPLLSCDYHAICKDAVRAVSNIVAGTSQQIQCAVDAKVFPKVVRLLRHTRREVVTEALWSVDNVLVGGTQEQANYVADLDCHSGLATILKFPDSDLVCLALNVLGNLLKLDKRRKEAGKVAAAFEECNGVENLWKLVNSENDKISEMADGLLTKYFTDT